MWYISANWNALLEYFAKMWKRFWWSIVVSSYIALPLLKYISRLYRSRRCKKYEKCWSIWSQIFLWDNLNVLYFWQNKKEKTLFCKLDVGTVFQMYIFLQFGINVRSITATINDRLSRHLHSAPNLNNPFQKSSTENFHCLILIKL